MDPSSALNTALKNKYVSVVYEVKKFKETAYISLVRSILEYAAPIWDPHLRKDIAAIESVQRKAARFVKHDYHRTSSVSAMLAELGWANLADRRRDLRLALMFKIVHHHVAVPADTLDLKPPNRDLRKNHKHKYQNLAPSTVEFKNSFVPRTIPVWNLLNKEVAEACSVDVFKSSLAKLGVPSV